MARERSFTNILCKYYLAGSTLSLTAVIPCRNRIAMSAYILKCVDTGTANVSIVTKKLDKPTIFFEP